MFVNFPSLYDPKDVEEKRYKFWLEGEYFRAAADKNKEAFTVVIPPPNVTGTLHMGHALNNTIQDVLVRWKRMQGFDTLWVPGTDHAGIATQIKVEEHLAAEGTSRHEQGREKFLEKVWEWKKEYHRRIVKQLQKLGVSCDWSRERFTLDEGCSRAVREVFVSLYERGLIYRGDYMINWCPRCHTALSDIEVEHEEEQATLTYMRYPLEGHKGYITVATTRPETMLGDSAVAVHPKDKRYRDLIGYQVLLPLVNRLIPIIADDFVDPAFGTGAVKVTPAHDPNDFEMGQRHGLDFFKVIGEDARMTEEAGVYKGLDRFECRSKVIEDMQKQGLIERIEDYFHSVGNCQRCHTTIEPLVSRQWFVKMKPLAKPAIEAVKQGHIRFVPERFAHIYLNWVENVRDWCISRQIWWGHRIPAWYCSCGEMIVARETPERCACCGSKPVQDPDVLDTWFSSALWPFSTLGWPEKTFDLQHFFPTNVLVTGYDIIYFWVARMIFMSLAFQHEIPFREIYIHGLVRDARGRKMSKSLGNGIDPLEIIKSYGSDTLRFTLITGQAPGNDQRFRQENVEASRNFANKIWNASRFVLMNLGDFHMPDDLFLENLSRADQWILHRYNETVQKVNKLFNDYELGEAARVIYEFLWGDFCDWYVEISKIFLYRGNEKDSYRVKTILCFVLEKTLKLLHPFMPFITEEVWQHLPHHGDTIVLSSWPEYREELENKQSAGEMALIMDVIKAIRNLRSEIQIPPGKKASVIIRVDIPEQVSLLQQESKYIEILAFVDNLEIRHGGKKPRKALSFLIREIEVYLPLEGLINISEELKRLDKELVNLEKDLKRVNSKLNNKNFLIKAPSDVVAREKEKHQEFLNHRQKLSKRVKELEVLSGN